MKEKSESSRYFLCFLFIICGILLIFSIVGFLLFVNRKPKIIDEEENGGKVILKYTNDYAGLKMLRAIPTSDMVGIQNIEDGTYFDFSIETSIDEAVSDETTLPNTTESTMGVKGVSADNRRTGDPVTAR